MKARWTPRLDEILLESRRNGLTYRQIADVIRRESRGRFKPHPTTVYRRLISLGAVQHRPVLDSWAEEPSVSTQGDAVEEERIPARTRAPFRGHPPPVTVLALQAERVDSVGLGRALEDLLCATPPGWSWELEETEEVRRDAVASARHQAALRGDAFEVLESESGQPPVVLIRRAGEQAARLLVLVVVRYVRA